MPPLSRRTAVDTIARAACAYGAIVSKSANGCTSYRVAAYSRSLGEAASRAPPLAVLGFLQKTARSCRTAPGYRLPHALAVHRRTSAARSSVSSLFFSSSSGAFSFLGVRQSPPGAWFPRRRDRELPPRQLSLTPRTFAPPRVLGPSSAARSCRTSSDTSVSLLAAVPRHALRKALLLQGSLPARLGRAAPSLHHRTRLGTARACLTRFSVSTRNLDVGLTEKVPNLDAGLTEKVPNLVPSEGSSFSCPQPLCSLFVSSVTHNSLSVLQATAT